MPSLPPISTLPLSPTPTLTTTLDLLFEPSPALHALALPILRSTSFASYAALISAVHTQLTALLVSDVSTLSEILCSHPRLGEKVVESALSRGEQAGLKGEGEGELQELNGVYEGVFGGLRYVVFVNARPRQVIMQDMRRRIERGDIDAERREAIQAMCDIAADRAAKMQGQES